MCLRLTPDSVDALGNIGLVHGRSNRYEKAVGALDEAIRLDPNSAAAHFNLGLVHIDFGARAAALEQRRVLKRLDRNLADRLHSLIK